MVEDCQNHTERHTIRTFSPEHMLPKFYGKKGERMSFRWWLLSCMLLLNVTIFPPSVAAAPFFRPVLFA